ncbi:MAG: ABC transporter ATP-binding protein [Blautia sp.]|nr:ABC transporter ATP-binding protein [Blautia sp.]
MDDVLRYDHVDISYNGRKVVKEISFTVSEGEILGIVGESGSGKSTVIKAAMGLLGQNGLCTRGDIWYRDKNLTELSAEVLRKLCGPELGMIFQNSGASFCPVRTVEDQLYESVKAHRPVSREEFRREAAELMRRTGLEEGGRVLKSYPFELSGGMQQRVGIAAAMLLKPAVLFADEPTSALDTITQKQVVEEMLLIRKTFGTAIVLVTHNIGVIRAMADKVLVMKDGIMCEYGDARQVLSSPQHQYTKALLEAVPKLKINTKSPVHLERSLAGHIGFL